MQMLFLKAGPGNTADSGKSYTRQEYGTKATWHWGQHNVWGALQADEPWEAS